MSHSSAGRCEENASPSSAPAPWLALASSHWPFHARSHSCHGVAKCMCEAAVTKGWWPFPRGSLMPSDHQKWGKSGELCRGDGTAGDNRRREKGLEKFLVSSYSLKGRNTVVALGVIVPLIFAKYARGKQLCLSPFGASPALPILGTQAISCEKPPSRWTTTAASEAQRRCSL